MSLYLIGEHSKPNRRFNTSYCIYDTETKDIYEDYRSNLETENYVGVYDVIDVDCNARGVHSRYKYDEILGTTKVRDGMFNLDIDLVKYGVRIYLAMNNIIVRTSIGTGLVVKRNSDVVDINYENGKVYLRSITGKGVYKIIIEVNSGRMYIEERGNIKEGFNAGTLYKSENTSWSNLVKQALLRG